MNLVFELENVICTPHANFDSCKPIVNVIEFMQWLRKEGHGITIWSKRKNEMESKIKTEQWLRLHQIPYDRLLFDKPRNSIYVDETPSNCKYFTHNNDMYIIASLFEDWKKDIRR
tara:strand:+ start:6343 stop:6687 length:345 start_codon:yes stop_codon:yes gene_type:complete